ncbi:MAG: cell division protein FtsQ/DivIB, partial [Candidatus Eremiobacteraeota bacterium]|nr:cell division protein FtsQ/DivIB [Candidatus Eremiobacteraeota bacterium]
RKAAVRDDENLWFQNMHAAALRIESIPYVKTASLHRSLPADLQIIVTERAPDAVVATDSGTALIDDDGRVLESGGVYPVDLPRVRIHLTEPLSPGRFLEDPRIARVQRDYKLLLRNKVVVYALQFNKRTELTVQLRSGVTVELGEDADLAQKAALVDPILHQLSGQIEKVTTLDLRAPGTPIVVYK